MTVDDPQIRVPSSSARTLVGRIKIHPVGYGFVVPDDKSEDVHVSARNRGAAMDADTVEIQAWPGIRGTEGRVLRVIARGRAKITGKPEDKFVFKVPSLRNVEKTAPYFHDGHSPTLESAIVRHRGDSTSVIRAYGALKRDDQEALLAALASALSPDGVMLIREADASAGWRFTAVRWGNRLKALAFGAWQQQFHFRTASAWHAAQ